jgi:hypothetical protein
MFLAAEWLDMDPPTRTDALTMLTRTLAGPFPGPNRLAIAAILADNYLTRIADWPASQERSAR